MPRVARWRSIGGMTQPDAAADPAGARARRDDLPGGDGARRDGAPARPGAADRRAPPASTLAGRDLGRRIRDVARGLVALGIEPGDRVAVLGRTRPEWTLADCAVLAAGAVVVPIYHTNSPEECALRARALRGARR